MIFIFTLKAEATLTVIIQKTSVYLTLILAIFLYGEFEYAVGHVRGKDEL
jgi:hypothetical protein